MAGPLNPPRGRLDEVVVLEDCSQMVVIQQ
jgi:hypothetical protein